MLKRMLGFELRNEPEAVRESNCAVEELCRAANRAWPSPSMVASFPVNEPSFFDAVTCTVPVAVGSSSPVCFATPTVTFVPDGSKALPVMTVLTCASLGCVTNTYAHCGSETAALTLLASGSSVRTPPFLSCAVTPQVYVPGVQAVWTEMSVENEDPCVRPRCRNWTTPDELPGMVNPAGAVTSAESSFGPLETFVMVR